MKLLTKIYLAFGFIMLVFTFVTASYVLQTAVVQEDVEQAMVSSEILRLSQSMGKAIVDTETGLRGFQVSDNEAFLEPYYNGQEDYEFANKQLFELVKDPAQRRLLTSIDSTYKQWLHVFAIPSIKLQKEALRTEAGKAAFEDFRNNMIRAGAGRKIMSVIRGKISTFDNQEVLLKESRMQELKASLRFTDNLSIALTVVCFAVGLFIIQVLVKAIRERFRGIAAMATEIANGDLRARVTDERNDEITQVSKSLNVMAQRLEASFSNLKKINSELDQFAYVVSHDLKAPLRAINSLAEWIEEDLGSDLDQEIKHNLQLMRGRVFRMENLINGILDYSRIGRKELPKQHFSCFRLVEETIESLALPDSVSIEVSSTLPELNTERILLQQVFTNLISNAVKYNDKPHPVIQVGARELARSYEFWIADNGPGIGKEYHEKVFGIFQTMEARDTKESTGIGLAIVKKIVSEKGCSIRIESEEGMGSRFVFTWPKSADVVKASSPSAVLVV
ncbi:phospho-acceptor domain-containing protein [Pontibacter ummariensis]|uniref:histidine kinase n=1 Tax=Pontibacter ummariensis TaxID=1610492 RepID=A0A239DJM3_9BACT|nr:sensor histidine kinase [Pontibacter ummariensis]PRY14434.1 phospho-acceptor domain-containing protein [Pontibacter ummariensis]SNS31903.1 His Kinase A (phospho-acceptor) domain-containing protein [Pontibacter ummariensis]